MKFTLALLSMVAGMAAAQGVTTAIAPKATAPAGCAASYDGQFEVTVATVVSKRDALPLQKKSTCGSEGILVVTLADTVLTDAQSRTGYIASNYQFQFDGPAQAGAIYTAGFSLCGNMSLALGGSTVFYQCKSGSFWNLYDRSWAAQCEPVEIIAMPCGSDDTASQVTDGQVVATEMVTTTIVKPISDGQPQVITTAVPVPMCQINDGQVQVVTTPCASITVVSSSAATTSPAPVSQYTDGQIQVTPPASTPASTSTPPATTAPATTVVLPTETAPVSSSMVTSVSSVATVTSAAVTTAAASTTPAAATTSAVAVAGAGRLEMGSLAALAVGLVGAVAFL